ncbi:MAG: hypothetical protein ACREMY_12410 [bacterium]
MQRKQLTDLKAFAKAVGLVLKAEKQHGGSTDYVLCDGKGEPLVTEFHSEDIVESITVYAGSHPAFKAALEVYSSADFARAFTPNKHGELA